MIRPIFSRCSLLLLVLAVAGCGNPTPPQDELIQLARENGFPLFASRGEVPTWKAAEAVLTKIALIDLQQRSSRYRESRNPEIAQFAGKLETRYAETAEYLGKIIELNELIKHQGQGLLSPEMRTLMCVFDGVPENKCDEEIDATFDKLKLIQIRNDTRQTYWKLFGDIKLTYETEFRRLLTEHVKGTLQPSVTIDFDECWCTNDKQDLIEIRNSGEADWVDAVIHVKVLNRDQSLYHDTWHYAAKVPAGESVFTRYRSTDNFRQPGSFDRVAALKVEIWGRNLLASSVDYVYTGAEQDADIAANVQSVKVRDLSYLAFDKGFIFDDQRGLAFGLSQAIPVPHDVIVTFSRPGREETQEIFSQDAWSGNSRKFREKRFRFRPTRMEVKIGFRPLGSRYTHELGSWTLE